MKYKLAVFFSFCLLFITIGLILVKSNTTQPITTSQINHLNNALDGFFNAQLPPQPKQSGDSILAVIYKKANATWFIKARAKTALIEQQTAEFNRLFHEQMQFDENQQADLSHIPSRYRVQSEQSMRIATFNLNGVEVAVSRLSGSQDIQANIQRWRNQLGLAPSSPSLIKYQDDNNTILVRLDQESATSNTAQRPEKENLEDFLELALTEKWSQLETTGGMASGRLQLNDQGKLFEVAILRLPANVPLETVLAIWKEKVGIKAEQQLDSQDLQNNAGQNWQLIPMGNQQTSILIALHKGATRYTFLRLSSGGQLTKSAEQEFKNLLQTAKVIKP